MEGRSRGYYYKSCGNIPVETQTTNPAPAVRRPYCYTSGRNRGRRNKGSHRRAHYIPIDIRTTNPAPDLSVSIPEHEEKFNRTSGNIPVETKNEIPTPDILNIPELEDDFNRTSGNIPVETQTTILTSDHRVSIPENEEKFNRTSGNIPVETQTAIPTPGNSLSIPPFEEYFNRTSGNKPVERQTTILTSDRDLSIPELEENLNGTSGNIPVKTQTAILTPDCSLSIPGLKGTKTKSGKIDVQTQTTSTISGEHKVIQNLRDLLYSSEETDIVLKVQDRDFKSHRAILAARSAVFAAMLKHDMKEKASGVVVIEDCDPDAFESFLEHLYTGSIKFSDSTVILLYQIADKYDSPDLKEECVDFMSRRLSVKTFCEVTKLSLNYNESELLETAVDFFRKNVKKISLSVEWQSFIKERPFNANEFNLKALEYHGINE